MDDAGKLEILSLGGNLCQDTVMLFLGKKQKKEREIWTLASSLLKVLEGGRLKNVLFPLVIVCNNYLSLYLLVLFCCTHSSSLPTFEILQPHLCVCSDPHERE